MGLIGEVGAGWLRWSIRDAVEAIGYYRDARRTEEFYGQIAGELEAAFADGRLKRRPAPLPFVDPAVDVWLPYLPSSILNVGRMLYPDRLPFRHDFSVQAGDVSAEVKRIYDKVTNRKAHTNRSITLSGWVAANSPLSTVTMVDANGRPLSEASGLYARPDVRLPEHEGQNRHVLGFSSSAEVDLRDQPAINFALSNGTEVRTEILERLPVTTVLSDEELLFALERIDIQAHGWRERVLEDIIAWFPIAWLWSSLAALALTAVTWARNRSRPTPLKIAVLLTLVLFIGSRVLLFAILDASAWNGQQTRYLFPVSLLFAAMPFLIANPFSMVARNPARTD